jgi:hypothetical protein
MTMAAMIMAPALALGSPFLAYQPQNMFQCPLMTLSNGYSHGAVAFQEIYQK